MSSVGVHSVRITDCSISYFIFYGFRNSMSCGKIICFVVASAMLYYRLIHRKSFIIPSLYDSCVPLILIISISPVVDAFLITKFKSGSLSVNVLTLSFLLKLSVRSYCIAMAASHASDIPSVSEFSTNFTTLRDFVLEKLIIFSLIFLPETRIMYPSCDYPSLFPRKYACEKTRISEYFMSSFWYFNQRFGGFFGFLIYEFIILRFAVWYVSFEIFDIMLTTERIFCLVCHSHASLWHVVRNSSRLVSGFSM